MASWRSDSSLSLPSYHSVSGRQNPGRRRRDGSCRFRPMVVGLEVRALLSGTTITTVAGDGVSGYTGNGGQATAAELNFPGGLTVDSHGNLFIADTANGVIREVNASTGIITTVAGGGGTSASIGDGGPATGAFLDLPQGVAVAANGNLFIADFEEELVREVNASTGIITTYAGMPYEFGYGGDGGPANQAYLYRPYDVVLDAQGNLFISDESDHVIREVNASTGIITTVAGGAGMTQIGPSAGIGEIRRATCSSPARLRIRSSNCTPAAAWSPPSRGLACSATAVMEGQPSTPI